MQSKYGWVPNAIDVINEPNNSSGWDASRIAAVIPATAQRLQGAPAQRIGATSSHPALDPVAFINTDGRYAVVVKAEGGSGPFTVAGLPGGTYSVSYTEHGGQQATTQFADVTIGSGQALATTIPGDGALTIVTRTGAASAARSSSR